MTDIFYSIILGAVQGITEFLPISSTGHLIIFRDILGLNVSYGLAFDAVLQLATALALVVYFRKELIGLVWQKEIGIKLDWKVIKFLIIGTIPAVILGFLLQDFIANNFRSTLVVAIGLLIGSLIMYFSEKFIKDKEVSSAKSFVVGLFQSLALIPGMSRSGSTISGAYFLGIKKELAIRFSFLLSIPIILGSGSYELLKILKDTTFFSNISTQLLFGSISAFIFGLLSIDFLLKFLKNNSFKGFIIYRLILALILLIIFIF